MKIIEIYNNLFTRWSFYLLAFFGLLDLISPFLFLLWGFFMYPQSFSPTAFGIFWGIFISFYQILVFGIVVIYLLLEINANFRVKNLRMLHISKNIFCKIIITFFALFAVYVFAFTIFMWFGS